MAEVGEADGHLQLRQRNCPYADMIDDDRQICAAERETFRAVIGEPLNIVGCRLDGCPSCTFELAIGEVR